MLGYILLYVFPFAMMFAAASDLVSMTIPNKVSLLLIAGFIVAAPLVGMNLQDIGWHFVAAFAALAICFGCFAAGWMGGGDAKLIASTVLWLGMDNAVTYLVIAALAGGVLTLLTLFVRHHHLPMFMQRVGWIDRLHRSDVGIPYGIALGFGGVITYQQSAFMEHALSMIG